MIPNIPIPFMCGAALWVGLLVWVVGLAIWYFDAGNDGWSGFDDDEREARKAKTEIDWAAVIERQGAAVDEADRDDA